jgi:hypothetical protein
VHQQIQQQMQQQQQVLMLLLRQEAGNQGSLRQSIKEGYLEETYNIPKNEENAIPIFKGGEEARTIWPNFHANFEHMAESYSWGYEIKGIMLNRKCREHAVKVIKTLPEVKRKDYDSLVAAFHKAYIPSQWARAYRGALARREQKERESFLQYASDLRKMALLAYPYTDVKYTDDVREDHCLDAFMNGLRDPLVAVYINDQKPVTLEDAISAAEAYSAIIRKREISNNFPVHPDLLQAKDPDQAVVTPKAGDPKQPRNKPRKTRPFPKKQRRKEKGEGIEASWDNSNPRLERVCHMLEDLCEWSSHQLMGQDPPQQTKPLGQQKPAERKKVEKVVPRCYRCDKPGHNCRNGTLAAKDCLVEWYCDDHASTRDQEKDFQGGPQVKGQLRGPRLHVKSRPKQMLAARL